MNPDDEALLREYLRTRLDVLGDEMRGHAVALGLGVDEILRHAVAALEADQLGRSAALLDMSSIALRSLDRTAAELRTAGGSKTALARRRQAAERDNKLLVAALNIRAVNPRMSLADLADKLHERGHGGKEAIRKKLRRLLEK